MYTDTVTRIKAVLAADTTVRQVLEYEPLAITVYPVAYLLLMGMEREYSGDSVGITYTTRVRFLIPAGDDATAEGLMGAYVNSFPAALDTLDSGLTLRSASGGFFKVGERVCRALDFQVDSYERLGLGVG